MGNMIITDYVREKLTKAMKDLSCDASQEAMKASQLSWDMWYGNEAENLLLNLGADIRQISVETTGKVIVDESTAKELAKLAIYFYDSERFETYAHTEIDAEFAKAIVEEMSQSYDEANLLTGMLGFHALSLDDRLQYILDYEIHCAQIPENMMNKLVKELDEMDIAMNRSKRELMCKFLIGRHIREAWTFKKMFGRTKPIH